MENNNTSMLLELHESKMFRRVSQVEHEKFEDIARRIFEHFLALEVLSYLNIKAAGDYVSGILKFQDWAGFRTQAPDLYNLLVVIYNPDRFNMEVDKTIVLPELRIKRWMRSLASGKADHEDFANLIYLMQQRMHITSHSRSSQLLYLRRLVADWENIDVSAKKKVIGQLALAMREMHNPTSDLLAILVGIASSKGINL
jgi:hypothetical protein